MAITTGMPEPEARVRGPQNGLQPRARPQRLPVSALVQGQAMAVGHKKTVLLVSASRAQRKVWRKAIELEEDLDVAGEVADGVCLLSMLGTAVHDFLLLDRSLGSMALIHEVHRKSRETKTLIVGDSFSEEYISRLLSLGVRGLLSGCEPTDYAKAIRVVARGDVRVARRHLVQLLKREPQGPVQRLRPPRPIDPLTFRQREIVYMDSTRFAR